MHRNLILDLLSPGQMALLKPYLVSQRMSAQQTLRREGDEASDVYFPESGLISLLSGSDAEALETTLVGREGMVGCFALLGDSRAPSSAVVRVGGVASRISHRDFLQVANADPDLRRRLLAYVHTRMLGAARAIISASRCTIEQRVAGWLLQAHDGLDVDEIPLTHDCLAASLGVRRPGVTVALHVLEGVHAITSKRGRLSIRSRDILRDRAGSAYKGLIELLEGRIAPRDGTKAIRPWSPASHPASSISSRSDPDALRTLTPT